VTALADARAVAPDGAGVAHAVVFGADAAGWREVEGGEGSGFAEEMSVGMLALVLECTAHLKLTEKE
jgi:hypothetical protein